MTVNPEFVGFDYAEEADTIAEINRNISTLIATPAGTCPGDRNYGISQDYVGERGPVAENQTALEVMEKIEMYEPRVEVIGLDYEYDDDGSVANLIPRLGRNEDYVEDEE